MAGTLTTEEGKRSPIGYIITGAAALFFVLTIIFVICFASSSSSSSSCKSEMTTVKARNDELTKQVEALQAQVSNLTNQNINLTTQLSYALANVTFLTNLTVTLNNTVRDQKVEIDSLKSKNMYMLIGCGAGAALGIGGSVTALLQYLQLPSFTGMKAAIDNQTSLMNDLNNSSQSLNKSVNAQTGTIQDLTAIIKTQSPAIETNTVAIQKQTAAVQQQSIAIWSVNTSASINTTAYINNTLWMVIDDALNNNDSPSLPFRPIYDSGSDDLNRTTILNAIAGKKGIVLVFFTEGGHVFGHGLYNTWNISNTTIRDDSAFTFSVNNGDVCKINDPTKAVILSPDYIFQFGNGEIIIYENRTAVATAGISFDPLWGFPVGVTNQTFYAGAPKFLVKRIMAVQFNAIGKDRRKPMSKIDFSQIIGEAQGLRARNRD